MDLILKSCVAARPDKRAISNFIMENAKDVNASLSNELTNILLEGDEVEIQVMDKNTASILRNLRKLSIDYQIVEE